MGLYRSVTGMVMVQWTSADPSRSLQRINDSGIEIFAIHEMNDLSFRFCIRRKDYKLAKELADKMGDRSEIMRRAGIYWQLKNFKQRKLLLCGIIVLAMLTLYLPQKVIFVRVEGNVTIPTQLILEKSAECGIAFGASRRLVRSERMKNELLSALPQLQWAGINTRGCVAVISVSEKIDNKENSTVPQVSRIVASRDAVIVRSTVEQGSALCKVGQVVKTGDLLVSGYVDCGISVKTGRAVGEIYGQTNRLQSVVMPVEYIHKKEKLWGQKKYALLIGKKRINFYKDSGILGGTCGKMSTVNYMTLPGGFVLPVALVTEVWTGYRCEIGSVSDTKAKRILGDFADDYLLHQMLAGRILRRDIDFRGNDDVYRLDGVYSCLEMIGREQSEETLVNYGKTD